MNLDFRGDRRIAVDVYFNLLRDTVDRLPTVIVKFMYLLFPDISKIIFQSYSSTMNVHWLIVLLFTWNISTYAHIFRLCYSWMNLPFKSGYINFQACTFHLSIVPLNKPDDHIHGHALLQNFNKHATPCFCMPLGCCNPNWIKMLLPKLLYAS